MSGIYIHIPFCKTRCNYCDFYKSTSCAKIDDYLGALYREMKHRQSFLGSSPVKTLYFGGGTPSLLHPMQIQAVIDRAARLWDLGSVREITVEANPDDVTPEWLDALSATDVNRLSFGIQSFVERDLTLLGRRHTARQAVEAVRMARDKGFDNISVDLIFAIPGMTLEEWEKNVLKAVTLGVRHISVYHLSIEPGTPLDDMVRDGRMVPVDEKISEKQYLMAHNLLTDQEYEHYEISNYALGGERGRSQHNCAYWGGDAYLGLGPSAHSYDTDNRSFSVGDVERYIAEAGTDSIYETEHLSPIDKYNEFIMVSLRTCCGVRRDVLRNLFGIQALLDFEYAATKLVRRGLLVVDGNEYKIPHEKLLISNSIISDLFLDKE